MQYKIGDRFIVIKPLFAGSSNQGQLHGLEESNLKGCILNTLEVEQSEYDMRQVVTIGPGCEKSKKIFLQKGSKRFRVSGRYLYDDDMRLLRLHNTGLVDTLRKMITD